MAFPPVGTTVPALQPYQFSYNGYVFGANSPLEITKIEGIAQPVVRTGDAGRARDHGRFIGLDVMDGRDITITGELLTTSTTAWASLAGATVPGGTTEAPLFLNLPNFGTLVTLARVRKRDLPLDIKAALGNLVDVAMLFGASDPRWYATPTLNPSVSPPGTSAGFSFPLAFPLSFGGGGVAGSLSVNNAGNIEMRPILTVTGPCTNPSITNASITGSPNLTFNVTMASGDQLVIDTDFHTATYFTAWSNIGSTRLYTLARGSQWFNLPASTTSTIQFLTGDPVASGTLTVTAPPAAYIL